MTSTLSMSMLDPIIHHAQLNKNSGKDIINKVEEVINNLREEGDVIVCGDFNARIARKSGSVVNDSDSFLPMPDDYIPDNNIPRQSQDNGTNSHSSHFP